QRHDEAARDRALERVRLERLEDDQQGAAAAPARHRGRRAAEPAPPAWAPGDHADVAVDPHDAEGRRIVQGVADLLGRVRAAAGARGRPAAFGRDADAAQAEVLVQAEHALELLLTDRERRSETAAHDAQEPAPLRDGDGVGRTLDTHVALDGGADEG